MQARIRTKHDPARAEAEWLKTAPKTCLPCSRKRWFLPRRTNRGPADQSVCLRHASSTFGRPAAKARPGLRNAAAAEYQQGHDRLARVAARSAQHRRCVARANLGVMLVRLGEMALEQAGDAARARDEFDRAWKIQEEIALHPRSGNYKKIDNHRILSGIAIKQGAAQLGLGHPAIARDRFQKAASTYASDWTDAEPQNVSAKSYLSEAEIWLGVAYSHLGDWKSAHPHFDEAIQICRGARSADQHPAAIAGFRGDLCVGLWRARRGNDADRNQEDDEANPIA